MTAQPNQLLGHELEVLHALGGAEGSIGSGEVSRRFGMEHTRVNRLLGNMIPKDKSIYLPLVSRLVPRLRTAAKEITAALTASRREAQQKAP
jgi:hypothetical protein